MRKIVQIVQKLILLFDRNHYRKMMVNDLKIMILGDKECGTSLKEDKWLKKWRIFSKDVSPLSYKIYSSYIGDDLNILPPDVSRNYIEPVLNPCGVCGFYEDKNSLGLILNREDTPRTLFRSILYKFYDNDYNAVPRDKFQNCFVNVDKVIVKSAKGLGGHSVRLFHRIGNNFFDDDNNRMTLELLEKWYNTDFLVQECLLQSDYISQFNPTSINTIRMNTYRDVETGEIHVLGAVIRIGNKGAYVDNISSGGIFVGIDDDGHLSRIAYDRRGNQVECFNGIDFANGEFIIPNYGRVKQFAIEVSKRFPHLSLFAHDIALDKDDNPKIIEVNIKDFSTKFLQMTKGPIFGKYTDAVINFCKSKKERISISYTKTLK